MNPFLVYPDWLTSAWGMGLNMEDIRYYFGYVISEEYVMEVFNACDEDYDNYNVALLNSNTTGV